MPICIHFQRELCFATVVNTVCFRRWTEIEEVAKALSSSSRLKPTEQL